MTADNDNAIRFNVRDRYARDIAAQRATLAHARALIARHGAEFDAALETLEGLLRQRRERVSRSTPSTGAKA